MALITLLHSPCRVVFWSYSATPCIFPFDQQQKSVLSFGFGTSEHFVPHPLHRRWLGSCRPLAFIICCVSIHFSGMWNFLACLFHWGPWYSGEKVLYYSRHAQKYHDHSDHTRQSRRAVKLAVKYLAVPVLSLRYPMQ